MNEKRIVILTGERQIGKSTVCQKLTQEAREAGLHVSGLLTLRTGPHSLDVLELKSGDRYPLTMPFDTVKGIELGNFRIDPEAIEQGLQAVERSFPTDIFILDEVGPLELKHDNGWISAFKLLESSAYRIAFIVVRPELIVSAICRLPASFYTLIRVTPENREELAGALVKGVQRMEQIINGTSYS